LRFHEIKGLLFFLVNIPFEAISVVTEGSGAFCLFYMGSIFIID